MIWTLGKSNVVHLTFQVSQRSAATDLRWGDNFNKFLFRNSLLYIAVKKLRKSVNICQSYHKNKRVSFLADRTNGRAIGRPPTQKN